MKDGIIALLQRGLLRSTPPHLQEIAQQQILTLLNQLTLLWSEVVAH